MGYVLMKNESTLHVGDIILPIVYRTTDYHINAMTSCSKGLEWNNLKITLS